MSLTSVKSNLKINLRLGMTVGALVKILNVPRANKFELSMNERIHTRVRFIFNKFFPFFLLLFNTKCNLIHILK